MHLFFITNIPELPLNTSQKLKIHITSNSQCCLCPLIVLTLCSNSETNHRIVNNSDFVEYACLFSRRLLKMHRLGLFKY